MRKRLLPRWPLLLMALLLALALATYLSQEARAQPECPPGFKWVRMSGVGCVQENTPDIPNAKWSHTATSICNDGYKACYESVDYTAFDGSKCHPYCPTSRLVACVKPDAPCPGEKPAPAPSEPDKPAPGPAEPDLVRDLEDFLAGEGVRGPSPGQAAAAGGVTATLIASWMVSQLLSGARPQDLLRALSTRRRGPLAPSKPAPPWHARVPKEDHIYDNIAKRGPWNQTSIDFLKEIRIYKDLKNLDPRDPDYQEKLERLYKGKVSKDGREIKAITFKRKGDTTHGPIDEDTITIVIREPAYKQPKPPTPKPPTPKPPTPKPPTPKPPTPKPPTPKPPTPKPPTPKPPTPKPPTPKPPTPKPPTPKPPTPKPPTPKPPTPKPTPTPKPKRKKTKTFRVRVHSTIGVSPPAVGFVLMRIEIQELIDGRPGRRSFFDFAGAGLSIGAKAGFSGRTDWIPMRTFRPATLEDFDGGGAVTVLPGASVIYGWSGGMHLYFFGPMARVRIPAGWGYGLGATGFEQHFGEWQNAQVGEWEMPPP